MSSLSIGQLARRAGVAVDTVRYYERSRLLAPATRLGKRAAETKLTDIERRIAELESIADGLRGLVAACPGHGRAEACPILNALTQEESA